MAILILTPVGVLLTYLAANDSGLFDKASWVSLGKKLLFIHKH